ncbi:hypothetical protein B0T13DRAFT_1761 [Neurospora crassa]|nr:hypothetical protein B0T13DRAFT_1761 [Neurospora crassa]
MLKAAEVVLGQFPLVGVARARRWLEIQDVLISSENSSELCLSQARLGFGACRGSGKVRDPGRCGRHRGLGFYLLCCTTVDGYSRFGRPTKAAMRLKQRKPADPEHCFHCTEQSIHVSNAVSGVKCLVQWAKANNQVPKVQNTCLVTCIHRSVIRVTARHSWQLARKIPQQKTSWRPHN